MSIDSNFDRALKSPRNSAQGLLKEQDFFRDAYQTPGGLEDELQNHEDHLTPLVFANTLSQDLHFQQHQETQPSPPESSGKASSKSSSSSPNSQPLFVGNGAASVLPPPPSTTLEMNNNDFDYEMLDDPESLAQANALAAQMFGDTYNDVGNSSINTTQTKLEGMDLDGGNDVSARFFDFDSAASSPLGIGKMDIMAHKVPRVFQQSGASNFLPREQGGMMTSNSLRGTLAPTFDMTPQVQNTLPFSQTNRKRRSEIPEFTAFSPPSMNTLNFDTTAHPSPASSAASGIRRQSTYKQNSSPSSSSDDEILMMKQDNQHLANVDPWSPSSISFAGSPMATGISLGYPGVTTEQQGFTLALKGDQPGNRVHEKSRVETQIRVNLTLSPMPPGVTKLHLPTHTISKPKLLAKPAHEKSPDTLELYTSLICASAVEDQPALLQRALQRAADDPLQEKAFRLSQEIQNTGGDGKSSESIDNKDLFVQSEEDKPLNGGEIRICSGCIVRERKRAARKKVKRVDEEEIWAREEGRRIVVFNCPEMIDWTAPENRMEGERTYTPEVTQENAAEVWLPIRIACYCRHQGEKTGFRIIFTVKDHMDNLIAQNITSPILITDDHKTNLTTNNSSVNLVGQQQQQQQQATYSAEQSPTDVLTGLPGFPPPMPQNSLAYSMSDTNLLNMTQSSQSPFGRPPMQTVTQPQSRAHSRQNSISGHNQAPVFTNSGPLGPTPKKRKSNAAKFRNELTMTKLDRSPTNTYNASNPFSPTHPVPFSAGLPTYDYRQFGGTGPPTPLSESAMGVFAFHNRSQSMENLQGMQNNMFSAPTSAQVSQVPSRATSPTPQHNAYNMAQARQAQYQQTQFTQAAHNALLNHVSQQAPFELTRLVPTEGPCRGGIEITLLGSGFHQNHQVYFGDIMAPKTEYWSETTLVCLLPPCASPGPVQVMLRTSDQPQLCLRGIGKTFTYNDDTEHKMLALALQVINAKWSGKVEAPKDIAMRLFVDENGKPTGGFAGGSTGQGRGQPSQFASLPELEGQMLRLLDLVDMDDSPFLAKLNLRNRQGQTMLHFACSLGLSRFAAGLLARGATPDLPDRGGYTPLHMAAMHNHPDLVRRLILNRADVNAMSLSDMIPADVSASADVTMELHRGRRSRRNSATSLSSATGRVVGRLSRNTSFTAGHSAWPRPELVHDPSFDLSEAGVEDEDDEAEVVMRPSNFGSLRRSTSGLHMTPRIPSDFARPPTSAPTTGIRPAQEDSSPPTAALAALITWRDHFTNLGANLPNLNNLNWNLSNSPSAQLFPNPVGRLNTLMAQANNRGTTTTIEDTKEGDYKWWEIFSNPAPPAYDELFPASDKPSTIAPSDDKARLVEFALEKMSLQTETFASELSTLSTSASGLLDNRQKAVIRAHGEKVRRIQGDRRLLFFWLPILIIIMVTFLSSWGSQAFFAVKTTYQVVKERMAEVDVAAAAAAATASAATGIVGNTGNVVPVAIGVAAGV